MTMSDLCDYAEAYILVQGTISVAGAGDARAAVMAFKNCAPFTSCISVINNTQIDNAKDLDVIMPMYNLLEYSKNYRDAKASLYQFAEDSGGDRTVANDTTFSAK